MPTNKTGNGELLVAISSVGFGLMPTFAKMAYSAGISTYTLLFLRFAVAAVFMFSLMKIKKLPLPSRKETVSFFFLGAVGYVSQSLCYFLAIEYATSSVAALLFYTHPAFVMLFSSLLFKEKITTVKVVSLALALSGAFIIVGGEFTSSPVGIILALLASVIYTFYLLINSRIVKKGMGVQSSAFIMLGAASVFGIINIFTGFTVPSNSNGYLAVVLIALISTVLAFWALLTGMEMTGPSKATLISTIQPVVTVIMSVLVLSEPVTYRIIIGGCLVVSALVFQSGKN